MRSKVESPVVQGFPSPQPDWHLEPCFIDGQIEFDTERGRALRGYSIRPLKIGHKNWMFIGGEDTGWRSAVIYTFVEQVRIHGFDPFAYFEWVFDKLMRDPAPGQRPNLLPAAWIRLQREPQQGKRSTQHPFPGGS